MITLDDVLTRLQALDDDFEVVSALGQPPSAEQLAAAEEELGLRFTDEHRALLATFGCGLVQAKESVWPRPQELDIRPSWQFSYGVEIFGLAPNSTPERVDVVAQSFARGPRYGHGPLVAALRRTGDPSVIGYDASGRLLTWDRGQIPTPLDERSLFDVLLSLIDTLATDKERMKATPSPGRTELDVWIERIQNEGAAVRRELDEQAPALVPAIVDRFLAATEGDPIQRFSLIYFFPAFADDPRIRPRLEALARHADKYVRQAAESALKAVPPR